MTENTMTGNPNLIECASCFKAIAKTAQSCPHCGAQNQWIDSRIAQIRDAIKSRKIGTRGKFSFEVNSNAIWGSTPDSMDFGWAIKVSAGLCLAAIPLIFLIPSLGYTFLVLGMIIMLGNSLWGMIMGFNFQDSRKHFKVVCTDAGLVWHSNDDDYFSTIKEFSESL